MCTLASAQAAESEREANAIVPPALLQSAEVVYPESAREENVSGRVSMLLDIDEQGHVFYITTTASPDPRLSEAAMAAASQFLFSPATQAGKTIRVRIAYNYTFEIEEQVIERELSEEEAEEKIASEEERIVNFTGDVFVAGTRERLEGAIVIIDGDAESLTSSDGQFSFVNVSPGDHVVDVEAPGHQTFSATFSLEANQKAHVQYFVKPSLDGAFSTTVRGKRDKSEIAKTVLSQKELTRVPGTFGDAVRVVQRLPGVARSPFGTGALIVRGGSPDDSAVYIDGHVGQVLFHLGAGPSIINNALLQSLEFSAGGFGARYGNATAGIVELKTKDPDSSSFKGAVGIDLLQTNFSLEGPILGGHFFVAGRRSYVSDVLQIGELSAQLFDTNGNTFTLAPQYSDYQSKLAWRFGEHTLSVTLLGSDDILDFAFKQNNTSAAVPESVGSTSRFHRLYGRYAFKSQKRHSDGTPLLSAFVSPALEVISTENRFDDSVFSLAQAGYLFRAEGEFAPFKNLKILSGIESSAARFTTTTDIPFLLPNERLFPVPQTSSPPRFQINDVVDGSQHAFYARLFGQLGDLSVNAGLRADMWLFYDEIRTSIDPRLTLRYEWLAGINLKASTGLYHKLPGPIELARNVGNPKLPVESGWQYNVGLDADLTETLDIDWQLFYRSLADRPVQTSSLLSFQPKGEPRIQPFGEGRVYGSEFLLRQRLNKGFFGWIAYTLLRSERRRIDTDERWRPATFDQTHIVSLAASWQLPYDFEIGGAFRHVTGNPQTFAVGGRLDADTGRFVALRGARSRSRLPDFVQLDLRIDKRFVFDNFSLACFLDLQNATNRENFEFFAYNYDFTEIQGFPGLPILPVFGIDARF